MESAANVLTCVTPKHEIYLNLLSRYVKPQEYLNAQGIWRVDAENVQAYDKMLENGLAQELAGNSFTSTVVQAVVLASFVTCECWLHIDLQEMPAKPMVAPKKIETVKAAHAANQAVPNERKARKVDPKPSLDSEQKGLKRKFEGESVSQRLLPDAQVVPSDDPLHHQVAQQPDGEQQVVRRRLREKTPATLLQLKPVKKKRGKGPGNKKGTGKKSMATIWQKNEIFLAFQKAKSSGVEYPIKEVEKQKLPGCFAGCMFESKWGVARREQTWELLCATAPAMCKKHKELPNSLRRILGFEKQKHGHGTSSKETERCYIPFALEQAIEEMIMDRIMLGEETICESDSLGRAALE